MALLQIDRHDAFAVVRLNRPEKRNALSFDLLRALRRTARELAADRVLRGVVLCGAGPAFCAGIDLGELGNPRNRLFAFWELIRPGRSLFQQAMLVWRELPVPVIAALRGPCFGAGLQLALAADLRVAAPDAQLSVMEARWGLVPDMGLSTTLRGLVRADVARELTFSARQVPAAEAQELGLVSRLAEDPERAALEWLASFAERSPDALLAAKRVLDASLGRSPARALAAEKRWQLKLLLGRNRALAVRRERGAGDADYAPRQFGP
ncbi:crotonase/enoyl-CoA hydratase family protein [Pseudomarimonas salicorniae]|uniref:Crotonase/enoyl-CoA hydratase family protein n=1 Tax=Pseudomarimonas salicorniae TaxID=2933270 RepID=A0ABT0GDS6_9GAMM|nr:crotonase/enoyl-CoA hydratase family protein [Lysobacter sp. CAU 1642]MCK7592182.1 crotonase/enoyl-CoA hydratase family protein [Lysobacter sp. CAU 1642]